MLIRGKIISVNLSSEKGTAKSPVQSAWLTEQGFAHDAHAGHGNRQVSILSQERMEQFNQTHSVQVPPGGFAENLTIQGIDLSRVSVLDRFRMGSAVLEVTQKGKKCHGEGCAIYQQVGQCLMPTEGVFCRVIQGGTVDPEEPIEYHPRRLNILVITLSDRASAGHYEDLSGKVAQRFIQDALTSAHWIPRLDSRLIPDEATLLRQVLREGIDKEMDIIFTLGGTGIGPRDITPEVVLSVSDKIIPGIMESIRTIYGATIPSALLSRSVAALAQKTLIYAIPGSVKAVTEYLTEIFKTVEHAILMIRGMDH